MVMSAKNDTACPFFAHPVPDLCCVWRTAAVHRYENPDVTMTPSEFAKTAPVLGASMANLADQPIADLARLTDGKEAQRDTG